MFSDIIDQIKKYLDKGEDFALVQVIWRETPSSGKVGDKALVLNDGSLIGWIGGGCVRGIAIKEGLEAIREKKYRIIRISPEEKEISTEKSFKSYPMTCHSGGSMELLIEPVVPNPHIILIGKSNIARALAQVAKAASLTVSVFARGVDSSMFPGVDRLETQPDLSQESFNKNSFIIVSTQGEDDEENVRQALLTKCNYVGFVASRNKSKKIKEYLATTKIKKARIEQLKAPVGMDINAKLPGEVAVSILADVISDFRKGRKEEVIEKSDAETGSSQEDKYYINPVCNIPVSIPDALHVVEHKGHTIYFCCDGCKVSFDKEPDKYTKILEDRV